MFTSSVFHLRFCSNLTFIESSAQPMTEEPFISEIVGVEYENSFWRGEVLEKQADSYLILLLDRGIECVSPLKHMRSLPKHLKLVSNYFLMVTCILSHYMK